MRVQEFRSLQARAMSEAELQENIIDLAKRLRWLVYHTHDSRRSQPGFPDLVLVRGSRVMFIELKSGNGVVTNEQQAWLTALRVAGQTVGVWRPADWVSGRIQKELRAA